MIMLGIEVEYLMGRALATRVGERNQAEWPPHPQRLFSALVAVHSELGLGSKSRDALMWLESLPAPEIRAELEPSYRQVLSHWVPVNDEAFKLDKSKADFRHPLERRNRQERFFPAAVPADPVVIFQWPDATGLDLHREALTRLVENIAYLGHSASPVRACVRGDPVDPTLRPSEDGEISVRVPGPGRFNRLENVYELRLQNESVQPPLGRLQNYSPNARSPHTLFSPRAVTVAFEGGPRLALDSTLPMMQHLRKALLARFNTPAPAALTGHQPEGPPTRDPHIALVPLAFVNSRYADGSLKGAALVLPRDSEGSLRRLLMSAVDAPWQLHLGPLGSIGIRRVEEPDNELQSLRFSSYTPAAICWATVTPLVLDRHAKKKGPTVQAIIGESCTRIGLPHPTDIQVGPMSPFTGVPRLQDFHGQAKQTDGRVRTHVLLRFPVPVSGPMLLGAGRFIGLGVCMPFNERRRS
jgi:CRISPR-associated protein Csb2